MEYENKLRAADKYTEMEIQEKLEVIEYLSSTSFEKVKKDDKYKSFEDEDGLIALKEMIKDRKRGIIQYNKSIDDKIKKIEEKKIKEKQAKKLENIKKTEGILVPNFWGEQEPFQLLQKKETQIQYYERNDAHPKILNLVELGNKAFGEGLEKMIRQLFELGPRTSSENDGTRNDKKIEIKSARYWAGSDNCQWQHLEPGHDYEYVLFILVDFQCLKVMGIKKSLLMGELRDKKIVTYQGKQGWWTKKSKIMSYLDQINDIKDLDEFINS